MDLIPMCPLLAQRLYLRGRSNSPILEHVGAFLKSYQFLHGTTWFRGWTKWLVGAIHINDVQRWKVKPYHKLLGKNTYSKSQQNEFTNKWKPIFSKMMEALGLHIPKNFEDITNDTVRESYKIATVFLKSSFEYLFLNKPEEGDRLVYDWYLVLQTQSEWGTKMWNWQW